MELTPTHAIPSGLLFLTTVAGTVLAAGATTVALLLRKYVLARRILIGTLTGLGVYGALLLSVSLLSREKVLGTRFRPVAGAARLGVTMGSGEEARTRIFACQIATLRTTQTQPWKPIYDNIRAS